MTVQTVFEEFRFIWELLAGNFLFLLPFAKRKKHFYFWACLGVPALTALSLIHFPLLGLVGRIPALAVRLVVGGSYICQALAVMGLSLLCFRLTFADAVYFCVAGYSAQHLVYVLVHELLARMVWPRLPEHIPLYIIVSLAACCLFYIPIYLIFTPRLRQCGGRMLEDRPGYVAFNLLHLTLLMVCTFSCQIMFESGGEFQIRSVNLGGLICVLMLMIQYGTLRAVRSSQDRAVIEQMLRDSARNYAHSRELIEYVNRAVHDLKHTLRGLEQTGEAERQRFIDEARANIQEYQRLVFSDNEVLNTILAEKALGCHNRQIRFTCSVDGARLEHISVPDLYALLGNAVDNAVECVERFDDPEKRVVSLTIREQSGFTCIQTNNYCDSPIRREDGLPVTTKADSLGHGYGLKSIRYLAERYGGAMTVSVQDHVFILQIILPATN